MSLIKEKARRAKSESKVRIFDEDVKDEIEPEEHAEKAADADDQQVQVQDDADAQESKEPPESQADYRDSFRDSVRSVTPSERDIERAVNQNDFLTVQDKKDLLLSSKTKNIYFRPVYDNEPLFTSVRSTEKLAKVPTASASPSPSPDVKTTIGNLRDAFSSDVLMDQKIAKASAHAMKILGIGPDIIGQGTTITPCPSILSAVEPPTFYEPLQTDIYRTSIKYLMKLIPYMDDEGEEGVEQKLFEEKEEIAIVVDDIQESGTTEAMRQAQKYLRVHKIFEFLQFLTSHLLSKCPDDPIYYLMEILDKCLIYRAGFADPPLLYTKKHLNCLFNLMDRMRTGFITVEQYKVGMTTIGVCSYNEEPLLSVNGLVSKDTFIEDAYENNCRLLDDMLRRRWIKDKIPTKIELPIPPPPPQ